MSYLVIGGAGFIGSHLYQTLLARGDTVTVVDISYNHLRQNVLSTSTTTPGSPISLFQLDAAERTGGLERHISDCQGVFHLASQIEVKTSIDDFWNSSRNNMLLSINIIDLCCKHKKPLVFASSAAVYDSRHDPVIENQSQICPLSPYGVDKYATELYIKCMSSLKDTPMAALRFFNVYGERQNPNSAYSGAIAKFINWALRGEAIRILGDGNQSRDFIYVKDVANYLAVAMDRLISYNASILSNVCTGESKSILEVAKTIIKLTNSKSEIEFHSKRAGEISYSCGSTEKLHALLGVHKTSLSVGLSNTIKGG